MAKTKSHTGIYIGLAAVLLALLAFIAWYEGWFTGGNGGGNAGNAGTGNGSGNGGASGSGGTASGYGPVKFPIMIGQQGPEIYDIQNYINENGGNVTVDGLYGQKTMIALSNIMPLAVNGVTQDMYNTIETSVAANAPLAETGGNTTTNTGLWMSMPFATPNN